MLRKEGGVFICTSDVGIVEESTFTCAHCQQIVRVPPKANIDDLGGYCHMCGTKLICPVCVKRGICDPVEMRLARAEARYHALRSYGML